MTRLSKLHMVLGLAAGLLVIGSHAQTIAQGSLTIGGNNANFGVHRLNGGFMPDPMTVSVVSGGSLNVANMNLGAGCTGYATGNPDVVLNYTSPASFLRFFVRAQGDTALVINDGAGRWHCNDDAVGTNPMVSIDNPPAGHYDVWVSSYTAGQNLRGVLSVTELRSQQP
ncbi:MAG: peptidase S1 [Sandaracinaceae bacterium]|nr:peptidase S1 [Sandaracinaceae bacterium]MBK7153384.1 peptidase S1 [Sandaracinaceae bacterium]MBK7772709.1 peptidase S1 [Sandaracinaceae bacterium]MBK8406914.1 peptidase S1 [Sandaracinaceae bacterium]MBK8593196.1 peptidase S1 [Sandaracinaceae bacterium]